MLDGGWKRGEVDWLKFVGREMQNVNVLSFDWSVFTSTDVLNTDWLTFCTIGLATLTISDGIVNTLNNVCEILAESADGISASIKFEVFRDVYTYLSERFVDL